MKELILKSIRVYQKLLSPIFYRLKPHWGCRFFPSCSEYGYKAVEKYGAVKGSWKTLKRVIRCNPFNKGGYDPMI